ncbi:MAG: hypothetical protein IIZ70_06075 [Kiritimatiellae bacterium]|nr:hypothetical protein [Kiritimatiellia bacterium]
MAFFIRVLTALIPVKRVRRRLRGRWMAAARARRLARVLPVVRSRYAAHAAACRERLARGERLSVAFLMCDASMFSGESVFLAMRDDPRFEPFIAVAPRVTRGEAFLRETLEKTVDTLEARYPGAVRRLYDPEAKRAERLEADLVFSTVIYEDQTLPDWTTERLSERSLVVLLYYGYGGLVFTNEEKTPFLPNIVFAWRYFVSNEATREMSVRRNPELAANTFAVGYCKMDRLAGLLAARDAAPRRKKVLICPHHTIDKATDGLALSTFLEHADLFLRLPGMFPDVDFVFRPHPLLFPRLATAKWWGEARTEAYRARMESLPNVEFQQGGDYFETFASSDALVHDCGSFLAEYFYTGRPQCYLLADDGTAESQFLPFSRRLLEHTVRACTDDDIVAFVRRVVVAGDDPGRAARDAFAAREVCVNHPHATDAVIAAVLAGITADGGKI